jgi:UDP-N-acetylglucosamine acyltransferase
MSTNIHSTAIISSTAQIDTDVSIGPYSIIGPHVVIGKGCEIKSHVVIEGHTTIGAKNRFFQFCSIGAEPQDYSYKGEPTSVEIGDCNTFREFVTVNCGTLKQDGVTRIGNNSLIMAYVHFGHDTIIGNNCTIANSVNFGGHVTIGDHVIISGNTGVQQFVTIGTGVFIGGQSAIDRDIPSFCIALGNRSRLKGVNIIGLKRLKYKRQTISEVVDFLEDIKASSLSLRAYIDRNDFPHEFSENEIIRKICVEIRSSKLGIVPFVV